MTEKKYITEKDHPEKDWYSEAHEVRLNSLREFVDRVMNDYRHDYGTVCKAIAASALAAAYAADHSDGARGGITGFQAGFVMWEFIRGWMFNDNKTGLRIVDYDNMLYPQYEDRFEKTISKDTWKSLQEEAKKNLEARENANAHPNVIAHWRSIIEGVVPFGYTVRDD